MTNRQSNARASNRPLHWRASGVSVALAGSIVFALGAAATATAATSTLTTVSSPAPTGMGTSSATSTTAPSLASQATAPQLFLNILSPMSYTVIANKHYPLNPTDWVPPDIEVPAGVANPNGQGLRAVAANALSQLNSEAQAAGVGLVINSGYRSYDTQVELYNRYVAQDGLAKADTYSARPGHSEHQTGLAVDVTDGADCGFQTCFGQSSAGQWLAANAYLYGFIVRYPDGGTPITGYMYEPWHLRYVGVQPATMMHDQGITTLEEFFHLEPAPDYLG